MTTARVISLADPTSSHHSCDGRISMCIRLLLNLTDFLFVCCYLIMFTSESTVYISIYVYLYVISNVIFYAFR